MLNNKNYDYSAAIQRVSGERINRFKIFPNEGMSMYQRLIVSSTPIGIHSDTSAHKTEVESVWKLKNVFSLILSYSHNNPEADIFYGKFAI